MNGLLTAQEPRHLLGLRVSAQVIDALIASGPHCAFRVDGLPLDAKRVSLTYEPQTDTVLVVYEHHSFPLAGDGWVSTIKAVVFSPTE
jgi:hypothetical protein